MKIVCLANSFRDGGRCIGGIALEDNGAPVFRENRPLWIRPIVNEIHEEIPAEIAGEIMLLDIIEFPVIGSRPHGHQTENTLTDQTAVKITGKYDLKDIRRLVDNNDDTIFGNKGKAVSGERIGALKHSLSLIRADKAEIKEVTYEEGSFPKVRIVFTYHGIEYNFPVTDPAFLYNYKRNHNLIRNTKELYLTLSLAAPYNDWYYKLAAGIISEETLI